ncbi:nucleoside recognition domain-containing protein [Candidatus Auribacterota bacterium]
MYQVLLSSAKYLITVLPLIAVSLFCAALLQNLGMLNKFAKIARPLTRYGNLSDECGISFLTAFASPAGANAILMKYYKSGSIEKKELAIAVLTNSFPVIFIHWRSMLPTLIIFLGRTGAVYFGILTAIGFLCTLTGLTAGRLILKKNNGLNGYNETVPSGRKPFKVAVKNSFTETFATFKKIAIITACATIAVFLLIHTGIFESLEGWIRTNFRFLPIPPEGISIIVGHLGHYVASYSIAGNLLSRGMLSHKNIILCLLTAQAAGAFFTAIRASAPYYVGIFGVKLGVQLMALTTAVRTGLILVAIVLLYYLW